MSRNHLNSFLSLYNLLIEPSYIDSVWHFGFSKSDIFERITTLSHSRYKLTSIPPPSAMLIDNIFTNILQQSHGSTDIF